MNHQFQLKLTLRFKHLNNADIDTELLSHVRHKSLPHIKTRGKAENMRPPTSDSLEKGFINISETNQFTIKINNQVNKGQEKLNLYETLNSKNPDSNLIDLTEAESSNQMNLNSRNSIRKVARLNSLAVNDLKSKLRAKSVSKIADEVDKVRRASQPSLPIQGSRLSKQSSSEMLKNNLDMSPSIFKSFSKINTNTSQKNILRVGLDQNDRGFITPLIQ